MITMSALKIKKELRELIDRETDTGVLEAIKTLLTKSIRDPELRKKLTRRALRAEDDIAAGRLNRRSEIETKLKARLDV